MTKVFSRLIFALPLVLIPGIVFAASPVDNYSAIALTSSQYRLVVANLEPVVQRNRSDESLLLNLAMAYRHLGRDAEADALYRRVLSLDNAELDTANGGTISSHVVARRAIAAQPLELSQR
jgi:Flp pilus assembly protein TadD